MPTTRSRFSSYTRRPTAPLSDGSRAARCAVVAVATWLAACSTVPSSRADADASKAAEACAGWSMADYASARVVRRIRVYTDPDTGDSAMEETPYAPRSTPLLQTGTILREYDFGAASKVQIVVGPANLDIPLHPAPYRENFLVLKGSVLMKLGNGQQRQLLPGDMTIFEDTTASKGHGGLTGACGYVSLDIVP